MRTAKVALQGILRRFGYEIVRLERERAPHYLDEDRDYSDIIKAVLPYTLTSRERIAAVIDAARYVSRTGIAGAVVECGVWRGGSSMAAALALKERLDFRELFLFDTFGGMTAPTKEDIDFRGNDANGRFVANNAGTDDSWCYASLDDVQQNISRTGYPLEKVHYVQGDVLTTLPSAAPEQIAILRLDTDWYESTKHELQTLYSRLTVGGILIVDDYGHWRGSRAAVDEYFGDKLPFLCRIDYTGRIAIRA